MEGSMHRGSSFLLEGARIAGRAGTSGKQEDARIVTEDIPVLLQFGPPPSFLVSFYRPPLLPRQMGTDLG